MDCGSVHGLLADANVEGHFYYVVELLESLGLSSIFNELAIDFRTFNELGLPNALDDRSLWHFCQCEGWVLFTENRNSAGPNSLQAALSDSWQPGNLPVITLAKKARFERNAEYREGVASDVAELLFGIAMGDYRNESRIYVPRESA